MSRDQPYCLIPMKKIEFYGEMNEEIRSFRNLPSLRALAAFEAVARLGSARLAADELAVSQSAVSHQIANLEASVGTKLFRRLGKAMRLTETGQDYVQKVSILLEGLTMATEDASREASRSQPTISSPPTFLHNWLLPNLHDFYAKFDLDLRLVERVTVDGNDGHIDLAIEYRLKKPKSAISDLLFPDELVLLAAPEYIERHRIKAIEDLAHATLIETERRSSSWNSTIVGRESSDPVLGDNDDCDPQT